MRERPSWLGAATLVLALAGVGVSAYLTYAHYASSTILACSGSGLVDCERVTTSAQSAVAGIPVAVLGLVWFVATAALVSPPAWRSRAPWVRWTRLADVGVGMAMVLWLIYAELFVIRAICLWCTVVHVIVFALFVLVMLYGWEETEG
ncbi:MAG TPA: vitamin K epoxide reductase family protein [Actinomycetota bacterium]|jgi:uncharacterized membrane protein